MRRAVIASSLLLIAVCNLPAQPTLNSSYKGLAESYGKILESNARLVSMRNKLEAGSFEYNVATDLTAEAHGSLTSLNSLLRMLRLLGAASTADARVRGTMSAIVIEECEDVKVQLVTAVTQANNTVTHTANAETGVIADRLRDAWLESKARVDSVKAAVGLYRR